jgi:hypothetical protein
MLRSTIPYSLLIHAKASTHAESQAMKVVKPIFIVGTGRCGSTAFHRTLAVHPQLIWLSGFAEEFPFRPKWNRWAVTAVGNRILRRIFRKRIATSCS